MYSSIHFHNLDRKKIFKKEKKTGNFLTSHFRPKLLDAQISNKLGLKHFWVSTMCRLLLKLQRPQWRIEKCFRKITDLLEGEKQT
jgi:hypothetical protein